LPHITQHFQFTHSTTLQPLLQVSQDTQGC